MGQEKPTPLESKIGQEGSPLASYCRTVVGQGGLIQLFFYELINLLCIPLKGAFGARVRQVVLPFLLKNVGKNSWVGANCTIRNGKKISIGDHFTCDDAVTLDVKHSAKRLVIGNRVDIGTRSIFNCHGGVMQIGDNTSIGSHCRLGSLEGLRIGSHCKMGDNSCFSGASHSFELVDIPIIQQPLSCKGPTVIGDQVIIGERVTILDGVKIGNHVTILDDSLVNKDIAENLVVSGVPAHAEEKNKEKE